MISNFSPKSLIAKEKVAFNGSRTFEGADLGWFFVGQDNGRYLDH
jgi:hypothetical protein